MQGPPPRRPGVARAVLLLVFGGFVALCGVGIAVGTVLNRETQQTYGALLPACDGRAVPGARAYVASPTGHRVVGAMRIGDHWSASNTRIAERLRAAGVADADVVACFGEETETTLGTCEVYRTRLGVRMPGSGRTYTRKQKSVAVRLVAAATGQTITQGAAPGAPPPTCDGPFVGSVYQSHFEGPSPDAERVGAWLDATFTMSFAGSVFGGPAMAPMR